MSALVETLNVESRKFGETCKMAMPSQTTVVEGVETRHGTPKPYVVW
jgi:hypothetical protein